MAQNMQKIPKFLLRSLILEGTLGEEVVAAIPVEMGDVLPAGPCARQQLHQLFKSGLVCVQRGAEGYSPPE